MKIDIRKLETTRFYAGLTALCIGVAYGGLWLLEENHKVALIMTGLLLTELAFVALSFAAGETENNKRRIIYFALLLPASVAMTAMIVVSIYVQEFVHAFLISRYLMFVAVAYGIGCVIAGLTRVGCWLVNRYKWHRTMKAWNKEDERILAQYGKSEEETE